MRTKMTMQQQRAGALMALVVLVCAGLSGCGGESYARRIDDIAAHTSRVIITERSLRSSIAAAVTNMERAENGTMTGTVDLRNDAGQPLKIEYQVRFRDRAEECVEEGDWTILALAPQGIQTVAVASQKTNVQDFIVMLRMPD